MEGETGFTLRSLGQIRDDAASLSDWAALRPRSGRICIAAISAWLCGSVAGHDWERMIVSLMKSAVLVSLFVPTYCNMNSNWSLLCSSNFIAAQYIVYHDCKRHLLIHEKVEHVSFNV